MLLGNTNELGSLPVWEGGAGEGGILPLVSGLRGHAAGMLAHVSDWCD